MRLKYANESYYVIKFLRLFYFNASDGRFKRTLIVEHIFKFKKIYLYNHSLRVYILV